MTKRATVHRYDRDDEATVVKAPRILPREIRPVADTIEDIDEPTLVSSSYRALDARPAVRRGTTALMHVPHSFAWGRRRRTSPAPSWVVSSPSSPAWGLESVSGCVITNASALPVRASMHGTRAGWRMSSWTAALLCSAIVLVVAAATMLRVGPWQADRPALRPLPHNVTANAAPPPSAATPLSPVAEAPPKQPVAILKVMPAPKATPSRTRKRAPVVKTPVSKKAASEEDAETRQAIEVLRHAQRMAGASSFE